MGSQDDHGGVDGREDEEEEAGKDDAPQYVESEGRSIVECGSTAGPFAMEFRREWSPIGYERAIELFERGFYDHSHFFRVVPRFLVQFGISYTEDQDLRKFARKTIKDDPPLNPRIKFEEGMISFAGSGKDSRSSHLFVSYGPSNSLGRELWETPVGVVIQGMDNLKALNHSYGDMPPWGNGPEQHKINVLGKNYIEKDFPLLDKFLTCHVIQKNAIENIEGEIDDDYHDILKQTEQTHLVLEKTVIEANLLRKTVKRAEPKFETSRGFEVPLVVVTFLLIAIIIGMRSRNKNKRSKSN